MAHPDLNTFSAWLKQIYDRHAAAALSELKAVEQYLLNQMKADEQAQ